MREIAQPAERQNVMHHVADFRPPVLALGEKMLVMPDRVRPHTLFIHETVRRFDVRDFREPCDRHAEQRAHAVFDHHASVNRGRQIAQHAEIQGGRRELREIPRIGKKRPADLAGGGDNLGAAQDVNGHPTLYARPRRADEPACREFH